MKPFFVKTFEGNYKDIEEFSSQAQAEEFARWFPKSSEDENARAELWQRGSGGTEAQSNMIKAFSKRNLASARDRIALAAVEKQLGYADSAFYFQIWLPGRRIGPFWANSLQEARTQGKAEREKHGEGIVVIYDNTSNEEVERIR